MAKGYRMPASPEYRRRCSREAAAHKRSYLLWLKDPVAQAEHAARCAQVQVESRRKRLLESRANIKAEAASIRFLARTLRRIRVNCRPEALQSHYCEKLQDRWRRRRWTQQEARQLEETS
jgi:hypothetical protein